MLSIFKMNKKEGFSLVELSIVMVIIGLLIAALVKGKSVLENARIKRVIGDVETIISAYNTYYDLYSAYPGDDEFASGRWSFLVASGNGDALISGTNCKTGPANSVECNKAWQELRAALMVQGDPNASGVSALPTHNLGGIIWIWNSGPVADGGDGTDIFGSIIGNRNYIGVTNLRSEVAEVIDKKFDDGVSGTGSVRGSADYTIDPEAIVEIYYAL